MPKCYDGAKISIAVSPQCSFESYTLVMHEDPLAWQMPPIGLGNKDATPSSLINLRSQVELDVTIIWVLLFGIMAT